MPTPFASLRVRVTDAIFRALPDISFTVNGLATDGVFTEEYVTVDYVESKRPVLSVRTSAAVGVDHGEVVTASDGRVYKVRGLQPDGTGITKLILERQ